MSSLSGEELQVIALNSYWLRQKPLPIELWGKLLKANLYDWACEQQTSVFPGASPTIPGRESLNGESLAPVFELKPIPAPKEAPRSPDSAPKGMSTRALNRGRRAAAAVAARSNQEQTLGFAPRDLVMFALPHKRAATNEYERVNGRYRYRIETGNHHTIPFGQDRLFPLWLATAFKASGQPADNRIRFRAASDILGAFQQAADGPALKALHERIERWFHTTIYVYDESNPERRDFRSYRLLDAGSLWYHRTGSTNQYTLWQNVLVLNGSFADDLRKTTIPIDFETVAALRDMPGALDLYIWQAHRSWELQQKGVNRPSAVPLSLLLAQLGTRSPPRLAKQHFKKWQGVIKELWRNCPNHYDPSRNMFFLYPGTALFERSTTKLPGVAPVAPVPLRTLPAPREVTEGVILKHVSTGQGGAAGPESVEANLSPIPLIVS